MYAGHPIPPRPLLLLADLVADFPERRRPRGPVVIIVLVEPAAQDAACGAEAADLHAFAAPALFAVEDAKGRPADVVVRSEVDGACQEED